MFNFFFKKKNNFFLKDVTDFHNHIIPNIDDGSSSVGESFKMLEIFAKLGVKKIIPSPHIYKDIYPNTPLIIKKKYESYITNPTIKKHPIKHLNYGAEYMVDEFFINLINSINPQLLTCFKNYVLIEIPFFADLKLLKEVIFKLKSMEINPILAHPERYFNLKNIEEVSELKDRGIYLQLNALSLTNYYGNETKNKASMILRGGLYDFICTDAHKVKQLNIIKDIKLSSIENKIIGKIIDFQNNMI